MTASTASRRLSTTHAAMLAASGGARSESTPLEAVAARLDALNCRPRWRRDGDLRSYCPVHGGSHGDSLSARVLDNGQLWVTCFGGCDWRDLQMALGLDGLPVTDPSTGPRPEPRFPVGWCARPWTPPREVALGQAPLEAGLIRPRDLDATWRCVASYPYEDTEGRLVGVVDRWERYDAVGARTDKTFRPRIPVWQWDPRAGRYGFRWRLGLHGAAFPLFRLPELFQRPEGAPVIVTEGERDVLTLEAGGYSATTCAGGAAGWRSCHTEQLLAAVGRDGHVILDPDRDAAGGKWLADLRAALRVAPCRVELAA